LDQQRRNLRLSYALLAVILGILLLLIPDKQLKKSKKKKKERVEMNSI